MNKTIKENEATSLSTLVDTCNLYVDENGEPKFKELDIQEIGEKIEHSLLRLPEFLPPHTTPKMPARILNYDVDPEPTEDGTFVALLEFLPGDKVEEYYKKITNEKVVDSEIKSFEVSSEQDICNLADWLRGFVHEHQQVPRRILYTTEVEKLPPATFNVEVGITRQASNGTSAQR